MAQREIIFSSYRRLYRARSLLFRNDIEAMIKSRDAVRVEYLKHGTNTINDHEYFQSLINMADEAADMLRNSILQGKLNPKTGHYEIKVKANHMEKNKSESGQPPPIVQPITQDVIEQMEQKPPTTIHVEQTKAK